MKMESGVIIHTFTSQQSLQYPGDSVYIAEDLCISCARTCEIGPVARHLFGLWWPEAKLWLSPCKEIDTNGKQWILTFKLRFKPPTLQKFLSFKDPAAFDYYFRQIRTDFLSDGIPELLLHKNRALGLAATDMIREMLEKDLNLEEIKQRYKDFLPHEIWKKHRIWLKQPLMEAVEKGWTNSKQNVEYVKGQYMTEVCNLVPDYGNEQYVAQIDEDGKVYQVTLQIQPYQSKDPGLRFQTKGSKGTWQHVCSIADLYYVSIRNDGTVEVSRRNGIPKYFRFENIHTMHSFVSCLDGYYRLMEKWTFNLCKELSTPSLLELRALKCHGPAGYKFSCDKLREKRHNEPGSFLIRESSSAYDEFRVDWCSAVDQKPLTIELERIGNLFRLVTDDQEFPTLPQLLNYISNHHLSVPLSHCTPPSEYDKTQLLLCRPDDQRKEKELVLSECSCSSKCISPREVVFQKGHEIKGKFTISCPGHLKKSGGELMPVMIKSLVSHADSENMKEFLKQCSRVINWKNEAVVSAHGVILFNPLALVLEHFSHGPLDKYLQKSRDNIQQVDLIEAASYLARALWYLEEQHWVHGKIRCCNVLVAFHGDNSFKVKLSDPGSLVYSSDDSPWIPPECQLYYQSAANSPAADVWAFGTTLWEIFSFGRIPSALNDMVPDQHENALHLLPNECHQDVFKLILECWAPDPDNRKLPQAAMRDINQILYEVFNSRRSNSYATVYPSQNSLGSPKLPSTPVPPASRNRNLLQQQQPIPIIHRHNTFIKTAMRLVMPTSNDFNYDQMSAYSGSSDRSTFTMITDSDSYHGDQCVPVGSLISLGSCDSSPTGPSSGYPQVSLDPGEGSPWVIDINQLTMGENLGQGFYGEVYKASLIQWSGLKEEIVAVKRIKKPVLSETGLKDLLREIEIMKSLRHENIVEIKGLVEEPQLMLVMECVKLGSLQAYLKMYQKKLSICILLKFATDIAQGMQYLEEKHIVHRDLASRNILVASQDQVKISDFGLAQITGENHYYRVRTERNLPVRWYSPESIKFGKFSHKSDVWSYGVTLWEMFSFGKDPVIPGVTDIELAEALDAGQRLTCPENCPVEVYRLMGDCWQLDSHTRPSFQNILHELEDLSFNLNG